MAGTVYGKRTNAGAFQKGFRLMDGDWLNKAFEKLFEGGISRRIGITATPGGAKAGAIQLDRSLNRIDVVATATNSALLPKAIAGSIVYVTNAGANSANLYGQNVDTINAAATATAYALAAGKTAIFVCHEVGKWYAGVLG